MIQFRSTIRQFFYPKEFRIDSIPFPMEVLEEIETLESRLASMYSLGPGPSREGGLPQNQLSNLVTICTGLWRVRRNMVQLESDRPIEQMQTKDGMQKAFRHVLSLWDTLAQAGLKVQDLTGMVYDSGMSLKVIAFQPTVGLPSMRVIETIKPAIYYEAKMIQMGEVVVGTPQETA